MDAVIKEAQMDQGTHKQKWACQIAADSPGGCRAPCQIKLADSQTRAAVPVIRVVAISACVLSSGKIACKGVGWMQGQTCQVAPEEPLGCRLSVRMNFALKRPLPLLAPPSASLPFMRSASCSFTCRVQGLVSGHEFLTLKRQLAL